jgi:hypothetical protein
MPHVPWQRTIGPQRPRDAIASVAPALRIGADNPDAVILVGAVADVMAGGPGQGITHFFDGGHVPSNISEVM